VLRGRRYSHPDNVVEAGGRGDRVDATGTGRR
jgi:hypothetical protein